MQEKLIRPQERAPTETVANFKLKPVTHLVATSQSGRNSSLWTLAEYLSPLETLSLAFYCCPGETDTGAISGSIHRDPGETACLARADSCEAIPVGITPESVRDALALGFPGFRPETWSSPNLPYRHHIEISGIAVNLTNYETPRKKRLRVFDSPPSEVVRLSNIPLGGLRIDEALAAIFAMEQKVELRLGLKRRILEAYELRRLEKAHVQLSSEMSNPTRGSERFDEHTKQRHQIEEFIKARSVIQLELSLGSQRVIDPVVAGVIRKALLPFDTLTSTTEAAEFSLANTVRENSTERPSLVPDPRTLRLLGFRRDQTPDRQPGDLAIELGTDDRGNRVSLLRRDAAQHVYLTGMTGTGKSTLISNMIRQDLKHGYGVLLIDPHGDLYEQVAGIVQSYTKQTSAILANAGDFQDPFGLNLLETDGSGPVSVQQNFIANQMNSLFQNVLYEGAPEAFGPMFSTFFRNALILLMNAEGRSANLADFDRVFSDSSFRRDLLSRCDDEMVVRFWNGIALKAGGDASLENIAPYIVSKLTQFTGNPVVRPIITSRHSTLDFDAVLNDGVPCLVNLAKGAVGETDSMLLGGIIVIRLFAAAMARANLPVEKRRPLRVYLDEFSSYATSTLGQMLAECRKFGIELVLANQGLGQIDGHGQGKNIAHAILANVGSTLAFRIGPDDAHRLQDWYAPQISPQTLMHLPNHSFAARLLEQGAPQPIRKVRADPVGD
ncbi:type IV secretion system DNA-binding domain-containing protein [uncultured Aliiroseovarius sp.]|uniref:type IV secretory system conjugative DNA transfer family protein n=1 Tax=uncultured Aliiroseovarius sp. TaxID=1658783 RepID=UPI0026218D60|nr:type IV secretion system DNA-binding domain-containing protein [uncultured Aliiroseovarius sp.]